MIESCHFAVRCALPSLDPRACRFDESLEAAEDWDFWIQLRLPPFRFVPQETAVYRAIAVAR